MRVPNGAEVKIEPNTVFRGALFPTEDRDLAPRAAKLFERGATMRAVSVPDLYGGIGTALALGALLALEVGQT